MVARDTECPYCNHVSLKNTNTDSSLYLPGIKFSNMHIYFVYMLGKTSKSYQFAHGGKKYSQQLA